MVKRVVCFVIGFFSLWGVTAQQQISIRVTNQYEAAVDSIVVQAGGVSTGYKTEHGKATITIDASSPLIISAPAHAAKELSGAALTDGMEITLKKEFTWKDLVNPMFYIVYGGLWLLLFIVFAETGLFAGFFLPGDSLLFVAGIYSVNLSDQLFKNLGMGGSQNEWLGLTALLVLISFAGILGNTVGYWTGRKIGPAMYNWKDGLLFKKKYLYQAHDFYDKHGGGAIVVARFLPIIRTFAPIVAGIVGMDRKKFVFFNVVGCVAWVFSMLFAGHFLQKWILSQFGFDLKEHLEVIVLGIVIITTAPVLIKLFFGKKKERTSIPPQTPE